MRFHLLPALCVFATLLGGCAKDEVGISPDGATLSLRTGEVYGLMQCEMPDGACGAKCAITVLDQCHDVTECRRSDGYSSLVQTMFTESEIRARMGKPITERVLVEACRRDGLPVK